MATSRRIFLKSGVLAGAGVALGGVPALEAAPAAGEVSSQMAPEPVVAESLMPPPTAEFTRGIGVYPGNPAEDFSPQLVPAPLSYRNLALLRPAYHSSSYDYNLTAQLVTDGIIDTKLPTWVATTMSTRGVLPKQAREILLDHSDRSVDQLTGPHATVQFEIGGGTTVPEVDRVDIVVVPPRGTAAANWSFNVSVSDDGRQWENVGSVPAPPPASVDNFPPDLARQGQLFLPSISLSRTCRSRFYQVEFVLNNAPAQAADSVGWSVGEVAFFHQGQRVNIGGPYNFTSAWMSAGPGEEWVYVDLGAGCEFNRVKLHWILRAAEGTIQVSDDAERWRDLHLLAAGDDLVDDVRLPHFVRGRYVRVLMTRPTSPNGYILSELEIYGHGGKVARSKAAPPARPDGGLDLSGGAWKVQRSSLVSGDGAAFSTAGFKDPEWVVATVPGTVLTSYLNVEAIPDPNYGKNQLYVSDSFFYSDFWYRTEFLAPALRPGRRVWLNFEGVNWKAEVFLNGEKIGRVEGAFQRGKFDVTGQVRPGKTNALAVRIEKNATPGSCKQKTWEGNGLNGGALGSDNPTYHASVGWDWIPTIRGRNTGIVDRVSLSTSGPVTLANPLVTTTLPLPDTSHADISVELKLINHEPAPVKGTLRGRFGDVRFEQPVSIGGSASAHVQLDPSTHSSLHIANPQLWWPVGYGDPHLYDVELSFEPDGSPISDTTMFKAGIRQMTYSEAGSALRLWINGRRLIPRGGNLGFSESMLRYRAREYDAALRYHRDMNFNMVRNWVGQIGGDAFYEACNRHGVMVWQDFWLANPWDGPNPDDEALFMANAADTLLRIRNHPSIALYCGRNEGYPPKTLDQAIRKLLPELHPAMHYISSSADDVVGGHGPYSAMSPTFYFTNAAYPQLHSEIGMPNMPSLETVRAYMPERALWPQGLEWGLHDFCEGGQQRRGINLLKNIEDSYGTSDNLEEWLWLAHFVNYDGFRAEFEAQSKNRMGLLLWMSHPCWPSLLWQTYDYLMEPTPAYFASKNACEPLHIQWNRATEAIEVVNYSAGNLRGLTATAEILNIDGSSRWRKTALLDSAEDTVQACMQMEYPAGLTSVHFLLLTLSRAANPVSTNLYMRGLQEGNYRAIRSLPRARVTAATTVGHEGDHWNLTTQLRNTSATPALMVRLKVVRERSGDRILPVLYSDNYVTLLPGEQRTIQTQVSHSDTRGERPRVVVSGFNVEL
ncbi:MAG TPA: discoidin domain-containing protein [Acidisarcina sp.]